MNRRYQELESIAISASGIALLFETGLALHANVFWLAGSVFEVLLMFDRAWRKTRPERAQLIVADAALFGWLHPSMRMMNRRYRELESIAISTSGIALLVQFTEQEYGLGP